MTSPPTLPLDHAAWEEQQNPGVRAHCRRVAAWALEIASSLDLPAADMRLLEQICLLHHLPSTLLSTASRSRLLHDVAPGTHIPAAAPGPEAVLSLLDIYRHETRFKRLFDIFETANTFDEQIEMLPFEGASLDDLLDRDPWEANPAVLTVLPQLRRVSGDQLSKLLNELPVFPAVAAQAMAMLENPASSFVELELITRQDQVLAGELMRAANSSLYGARHTVTTVSDAVIRIGTEAAQRVLTAAALRPVLCRAGIMDLWQHSLDAATTAERIAVLAGMNAEEAFLLGLVHDVGRLLLSQLPADVQQMKERLTRYGCQSAVVEQLVVGTDHALAGAQVLKHWKFSERCVEAVRHHHQPERTSSDGAALLYLTEFWTASEEDIASNARLHAAERRLGIRIDELNRVPEVPCPAVNELAK